MKRILVAQTIPRSLFEGTQAPLMVGALPFVAEFAPDPAYKHRLGPVPHEGITIIVKATFSYAECDSASSPASLAAEPEPLSLDCPWSDGIQSDKNIDQTDENEPPEPLWYASDFVPLKRECDILLAGHAYADRPLSQINASIRIGGWSREFAVASSEPSTKIPLHTALAPHGLAPAEGVTPGPTPDIPDLHRMGFDFSIYNQSSKSHRIETIPPGMVIELRGLSARSEHLAFQLPEFVPCVFAETTRLFASPLEMRCDTLWLDTDRELVALVYRGTLFPKENESIEKLIVSVELPKSPRGLEAIRRELGRGSFTHTVLRSDLLEDGDNPTPEESGEVWLAKFEAMEETPEPTIPLEKYALISADLAEGREPRKDCLKKYGFDEDSFLFEERGWLEKMGNAAMEGDGTLAVRYGELFVAAQDNLGGPGEGRETIDEYAALKAEMEAADDPDETLRAQSLTMAAWMRIDRRWTRDGLANPALGADVERRIAAYRLRRERRLLEEPKPAQAEPPESSEDEN